MEGRCSKDILVTKVPHQAAHLRNDQLHPCLILSLHQMLQLVLPWLGFRLITPSPALLGTLRPIPIRVFTIIVVCLFIVLRQMNVLCYTRKRSYRENAPKNQTGTKVG